jgi:outer membrane protein insertion porin family
MIMKVAAQLNILIGWLILAVSVLAQDTEKVPPGEYLIGGIAVEGVEFTDKNAVVNLSGLQTGKKITIPGSDLRIAIEKLWKQHIFSEVSIIADKVVGDKIFLSIKLAERPRIGAYRFKGITKNHADDLRDKVKLTRGTIFTEPKRRAAVRVVKNFYQEKGYLNATVDFETEPDKSGSMRNAIIVTLKIDKGQRVKVNKIYIDGNSKLTDTQLKRKLKETKEKKFYRIFKSSKFIRGNFNDDKKLMVDWMQSQGYRDAKVISDTVIQISPQLVDVRMRIVEGKKYYFRNITWTGNTKYDTKLLAALLNIKRGDVYNPVLLDRRLSMDPNGTDISSLYLDDGYLFFRAEAVETMVEGDSVDIEIQIREGQQATINKVMIEGNTVTSDHVILREIRTLPGDKFSRADLIRSQRELVNLGYFDPEKMNVIPIPDPQKGTVDIKYIVAEKPSDQLFFQGGWGGRVTDRQGNVIAGGLVGTVGLTFTNFATRKFFQPGAWAPVPKGDGQRLSLSIQLNGVGFQNYSISFMEPWFGGKKPHSLGVSANHSVQRYIPTGYLVKILGSSVDLGRRMKFPDDFFRSYSSVSFRHYEVKNAGSVFSSISNGNFNILSFRQTFDRSSIDAPIFARSGSTITLSIEATPPWSVISGTRNTNNGFEHIRWIEFHKWKFDAQTYLHIANRKLPLVLNLRMRAGFLGLYDRSIGITPFERFYLGGDGINGFQLDGRELIALRGYQNPTVGPSTGATIFNKFTLELRQPLSLEQAATIWIHAFAEGGNAVGSFREFNPFILKRSYGAGIRVFLPMMGLLGVDFGIPLDESTANPSGKQLRWHFMIGQQF